MAFDLTAANTKFGQLIDDMSATATFDGDDYVCNLVSMHRTELEARGHDFAAAYVLSLSFQASDFSTAPTEGDTITYNSVVHRVLAISYSPDRLDLRVHLGAQRTSRR